MTQIPKSFNDSLKAKGRSRLIEKLSTMGVIIVINVILFLILGGYVIYRVIATQQDEPMVFVKTKALPPPPKPPARGGEASRAVADPTTVVVPSTVSPSSLVVTTAPSTISFKADMTTPAMDISLPNLAAPTGNGLSSGTSGGGLSSSNPFGDSAAPGVPGLVGELYDLKQTPDGTPTPIAIVPPETDSFDPDYQSLPATQEGFRVLRAYVKDWDQSILDHYYKSPVILEASQIFIPTRASEEATKAFHVSDKVKARRWVIHYHGTIIPPNSGRYRFLGSGDDFLVVRIGQTNVLDGSFSSEWLDKNANEKPEGIPGPGQRELTVGKWVDVQSGVPATIDILIGEGPGGNSGFVLLIQAEGDTSPKGDYPVFQIAPSPVTPWKNYPSVFTGKTLVFPAQ